MADVALTMKVTTMNLIGFKSLGYQQVTNLTAAVGLTIPAGASIALLQVTGQNVRWRDDGTDPTTTVGMVLTAAGDPYPFSGDLSKIKFIEASATAVLNVAYYAAL